MGFKDDETIDDDESTGFLPDPIHVEAFDEEDIKIAAVTHRGAVRSRNEDQYAIVQRTRGSEILASSLGNEFEKTETDLAWLLVVADGLGGQVSGQVASATAVRAVLRYSRELSMSGWLGCSFLLVSIKCLSGSTQPEEHDTCQAPGPARRPRGGASQRGSAAPGPAAVSGSPAARHG